MRFTDTHTHLYAEEFNSDRESLIRKAISNGISDFYMPNIDSTSIEPMLALEQQFPDNCFAMMGLHPCSVKGNYETELQLVKDWLARRKFAAVGEIGIDLYWDKTFLKEQQIVFRTQIELALQYGIPIVIHCRESFYQIMEVLKEFKTLPKGIFHCFSGTYEQAVKTLELGFLLGIGGVLTFKNAGLDKVIEKIDLKHLVLETDAPYLAPVPFRGKRNEPSHMLEVVKKLSQIRNVSPEEIALITSANAKNLFANS
jgi:TatD DNase family protein